jgi:hypothetical protein
MIKKIFQNFIGQFLFGKMLQLKLVMRNIIEYGYKTVDDFNSEILVFKR